MNSQSLTPEQIIEKRKKMTVLLPLIIIPIFFCILILFIFTYLSTKPTTNTTVTPTPTITIEPTQEPLSFPSEIIPSTVKLESFVTNQFDSNYAYNGILYLDFKKCVATACSHYLLEKNRVVEFPILKTYAEFPVNPDVNAPNFNNQKFMISGYYSEQTPTTNERFYLLVDNLEILVVATYQGNVEMPEQYIFQVIPNNPPPIFKYQVDQSIAAAIILIPTLSIGSEVAISGDVGTGTGAAGTSYLPLLTNIVIKAI